jgi:hypothetical protein
VDVLVSAARDADLLVLGSRGLHGLRALGSVSERVAHRAPSSVLVVRCQRVTVAETPAHALGALALFLEPHLEFAS